MDLALLIVVGVAVAHGAWKGLIKGIFDLAAVAVGVVGVLKISQEFPEGSTFWRIVLFIVFFVAIVALVRFLGWLISKAFSVFPLNVINRLLGGVLGLLKGALVFWVFLFFFMLFAPGAAGHLARAPASRTLWQCGVWGIKQLPPGWRRLIIEPGKGKDNRAPRRQARGTSGSSDLF